MLVSPYSCSGPTLRCFATLARPTSSGDTVTPMDRNVVPVLIGLFVFFGILLSMGVMVGSERAGRWWDRQLKVIVDHAIVFQIVFWVAWALIPVAMVVGAGKALTWDKWASEALPFVFLLPWVFYPLIRRFRVDRHVEKIGWKGGFVASAIYWGAIAVYGIMTGDQSALIVIVVSLLILAVIALVMRYAEAWAAKEAKRDSERYGG